MKLSEILQQSYDAMNTEFLSKKGQMDQLLSDKQLLENKIAVNKVEMDKKDKTVLLLTMCGDYARKQVIVNIELIVTESLQFILQERNISFKIAFDTKRKRPDAEFLVVSHYDDIDVETDPEDERGGGIVDILGSTLTIAFKYCFGINGPLFLDEPAKHLSKLYIPAFAEFLKSASEEYDLQIVLVTHNPTLAECGNYVYLVDKKHGTSQIHLLSDNGQFVEDDYSQEEKQNNEKKIYIIEEGQDLPPRNNFFEENVPDVLEN